MPMHDWTRVDAGIYHDFHRGWTVNLSRALNRGVLPDGFYAMLERSQAEPVETERSQSDAAHYAMKADRIAIRNEQGRVVAVIELVSPGNKDRRGTVAAFVGKAVDFLSNGIHFLMVDPFPPGPRDPQGLARAIWDELGDEPFAERPSGKPLSVASFDAGPPLTADAEALAVGEPLPEAPLFLAPGWYVEVPLEATYLASWDVTPRPIRDLVESASPADAALTTDPVADPQ